MKKLVIVFLLGISVGLGVYASDFSNETSNGQTFYFTITDTTNKYVSIDKNAGYATTLKDTIKIPEKAYDEKANIYTVKEIADDAFDACDSIRHVVIPSSVVRIGQYAFVDCYHLQDINIIGDGLEAIGQKAFMEDTLLTEISLPASVRYVNTSAFWLCSSLKSILVSGDNDMYKSESGVLYDKKGESLLFCPQGHAGHLEIPATVTSIADKSIYMCAKLDSATCLATTPPALGIKNFSASLPIYVPCLSLEKYKAADGWKDLGVKEIAGSCSSEVNNAVARDVVILSTSNGINIAGTTDKAVVCDMNGALIYEGADREIALPGGVYVVRIGEMAKKVIVK
jgi:hypothetical protein